MKRLWIVLLLTAIGLSAVSCGKEHDFVGVWRATETKNNILIIHQFTFRKDKTAMYCLEIPVWFQTECVGGDFIVTEKGQAQAFIGNTNQCYTFTKQNKELFCTELNLHFGLSYK